MTADLQIGDLRSISGFQQTLAHSFSFSGTGIHTGTYASVTVHPADVDTGRLIRVNSHTIPARADFVVDTTRCTTLAAEGDRIHTVEHLLSALYACQIDNALIELEGIEIPILDGSALPHAIAIEQSGIIAQGKLPNVLRLRQPIRLEDRGSEYSAEPAETLRIECCVEFAAWPVGNTSHIFEMGEGLYPSPRDVYRDAIAPARTFAFAQEVEHLIAAGLARGGSLDNALIITPPDIFSSPLRLPGEWCAHKLLDMLGDLALVNARVSLSLKAMRPGHKGNVRIARLLLEQYQSEQF